MISYEILGFFQLFLKMFLAALGLPAVCRLSLVVVRGSCSLAAVLGLIIAGASLGAEYRL